MAATPATTPNLGIPRFDGAASTQIWTHLNAISDKLDSYFGSWRTYSPVWSQSDGTVLSIGSGSLGGRYRQIGKFIEGQIILNWAADTNKGSGAWIFTLPNPSPRSWREVGGTIACTRGGGHYAGSIFPVGAGSIGAIIGDLGRLSNTVPRDVWQAGDWYSINFSYETA